MDDEKLLNVGKAIVQMIELIKSGNVKDTSLEQQVAFIQLEEQVYRIHISKVEDPVYYGRAQSVVEDDEEGEIDDGSEV